MTTTKDDIKKKIDELSKFVMDQNDVMQITLEKEKLFIRDTIESKEKAINDKVDKNLFDLKNYVTSTAESLTQQR